jgi:hypothetical protein
MISRLERDQVKSMTLGSLDRVVTALGATVQVQVRWQGERLDQLLDAAHAAIQQTTADLLAGFGWIVRVEVSFNHYGDRGRVDVLALHAATRTLLVIEVKSGIGDIQETLGRLDVKTRLGSTIAATVGWHPAAVVPALVIGDSRSARRIIASHAPTFDRFAVRGRQARAWLRRPDGAVPSGVLWFMSVPDPRGASITRHARVRTVNTPL